MLALVSTHGSYAHHMLTIGEGEGDQEVDVVRLAKMRLADKACSRLHPGLCKSAHADIYNDCKRLAKHLYDDMTEMQPLLGHSLK